MGNSCGGVYSNEGSPIYKYEGYIYWEEPEHDDDVVKIWHNVRHPDGKITFVHWSPYSSMSFEDFKLWIDLGMPGRVQHANGSTNLCSADLKRIMHEQAAKAMEGMIRDQE